jgi:hypothetical protein
MELFENPRGGTLGGPFWGPPMRGRGPTWWSSLDQRSLDDKTDLNRRMNETLEAIARAIFKDWFVDFGPTRAKMEGGAPYLAPEIWALFPDRLDDEGKPKEWEQRPLTGRSSLRRRRGSLLHPSRSPWLNHPHPSRTPMRKLSLRRRRGQELTRSRSDYTENCQRRRFRPYCPLSNVNTPEPIRHGTKRVIGVSAIHRTRLELEADRQDRAGEAQRRHPAPAERLKAVKTATIYRSFAGNQHDGRETIWRTCATPRRRYHTA